MSETRMKYGLMRILACILGGLMSLQVMAIEVKGVPLLEKIRSDDSDLIFNGAGVRNKYFLDLYIGSLYTPVKSSDANFILTERMAVQLDILSGLITSDRMIETVNDGFNTVTDGDMVSLRERVDNLLAVFSDKIKKGDRFLIVGKPGFGVDAYKNGRLITSVKGDDFRVALFSIWLGNRPADAKLKAAMLGAN